MSAVFESIRAIGVVPVVEIEDPEGGVPLARALRAGDIATMEVTFRTAAAADAIRRVSAELPEFVVGAGTLVTPADVAEAAAAGAAYGVSPGFRADLSAAAADVGLPLIPGVITPSEILAAVEAGHRHLKFFPAAQYGGIEALRSLAAPFARLGISFMPTGGVRPETLADYLALPHVFAVGGTWIASRAAVLEGRFGEIESAARRARTTLDAR